MECICFKYGNLKYIKKAKNKKKVSSELSQLGRLIMNMRETSGIQDGYLIDFLRSLSENFYIFNALNSNYFFMCYLQTNIL